MLGPPDGDAAVDVPGPDREIGTPLHRVDQHREVAGIVREVGVHLDERLVARGQTVLEAELVRGTEPGRPGAPDDRDVTRRRRGEAVDDLGGAVVAAVVDDEDVGRRDRALDAAQHGGDVRRLVESGDDDERPGSGHRVARGLGRCGEIDHDVAPCAVGVGGQQPDDQGHHGERTEDQRGVEDELVVVDGMAQDLVDEQQDESTGG